MSFKVTGERITQFRVIEKLVSGDDLREKVISALYILYLGYCYNILKKMEMQFFISKENYTFETKNGEFHKLQIIEFVVLLIKKTIKR